MGRARSFPNGKTEMTQDARVFIEVHRSSGEIERFALDAEALIMGRGEEADIRVDETVISRRHVKFKRTRDGRWVVRDLRSRNRTFYQGRAIKSHVLNEGDVVCAASIQIVFHDQTGASDPVVRETVYADEFGSESPRGLDETDYGMPSPDETSALRLPVRRIPPPRSAGPAGLAVASDLMGPVRGSEDANGLGPLAAEEESPIGHLRLGRMLRYKWTMVLASLLVAIPAVTAVWLLVRPEYRARGIIHVRPIVPYLVYKTEDSGAVPFYDSYKNHQVQVMKGPAVLQRVLDDPKVRATEWYRTPAVTLVGRHPISHMERLREELMVQTGRGSENLDLVMSTRNPADAAVIVNAVIDNYLAVSHESSSRTEDMMYRRLTEQYDALGKEIENHERLAAELRKKLGTGTPDELISKRRVRLDEMQAQLEALHRELDIAQWQKGELAGLIEQRDGTPEEQTLEEADRLRYVYDNEWRQLDLALKTARHEKELALQQFGDSHPRIVALNEQIKFSQERLDERQRQLDEQPVLPTEQGPSPAQVGVRVAGDLHSLDRRISLLKYQEQILLKSLDQERDQFDRAFSSAQLLAKENELITHRRQIFDDVRRRLDQKDMERNVPGSIELMAKAEPPTKPSQDRRLVFTGMALLAGLGVGLVLTYVRANVSPTIQEVNDVQHAVQGPFLGQLPLVRNAKGRNLTDDPMQSEYIRMVRTALLQRMGGRKGSVVQITSADAGAGKTTVAVMLGRSLAHCGRKVLLVDVDMRNPSVSSRMGIDHAPGLAAVLTSRASDQEAIRQTDTARFSVLTAGACGNGDQADPELLADGAFSSCLERWRRQYDIVLLDSSPVLPVADARILSRMVDGTIMVVREGHCQRSDIVDALACLTTAGGKLIGTVYIGAQRRAGYGGAYNSYYYYHASDK